MWVENGDRNDIVFDVVLSKTVPESVKLKSFIINHDVGDGFPDVPESLTFCAEGRQGCRPLRLDFTFTITVAKSKIPMNICRVNARISMPLCYQIQ